MFINIAFFGKLWDNLGPLLNRAWKYTVLSFPFDQTLKKNKEGYFSYHVHTVSKYGNLLRTNYFNIQVILMLIKDWVPENVITIEGIIEELCKKLIFAWNRGIQKWPLVNETVPMRIAHLITVTNGNCTSYYITVTNGNCTSYYITVTNYNCTSCYITVTN